MEIMWSLAFEAPALDLDITLVIQLVLFFIVMLFLNKYVLEPYLEAKDAREGLTEGATREAQSLREKAEQAQKEYLERRQTAYAEVEQDRKDQLREAQDEQARRLNEKRAAVQAQIADRQSEFDLSMQAARSSASAQVDILASEIARKLLA